MISTRRTSWGSVAVVTMFVVGCGASTNSASSPRGGFTDAGAGSGFGGRGGSSAIGMPGAGTGGQGTLPPEQEVESSFEVPVATGRYVWVANPQSGRVAYIEAATLAVKTVEAGNAPTALATVPGTADKVIALNVLSHDATVMQAAAGQLTSAMVGPTAPLANAWALSPDGRFAIAWTDTRVALADPARKTASKAFRI